MKLSIITINKNNALGLKKTIDSVINQNFTNYEYIIIDGASTDCSIETINNYSNYVNYWVSEPDTGMYNAMNKGIKIAKGKYCLFLNSGDYLISINTLKEVFKEIYNNQSDIFYSDMITSNNKIIKFPEILSINFLLYGRINHQNSLIKRSLFLEHGLYNENLKLASDWEFYLIELWKYKSTFFHIKTNISIFDVNGIGSYESIELISEVKTVYKNVFSELAETIIEYYNFRKTIYYNIVNNHENTKYLEILLNIYKVIYKYLARIF